MTPARPPLIATWMLRRLLAGPHSEALQGDLIEAWRSGRSDAWYWRQVLIAVSPVGSVSVSPSIRLFASVAVLVIVALGYLLTIALAVALANREKLWWPLVPMLAGILAGLLPLGFAMQRRRSSHH